MELKTPFNDLTLMSHLLKWVCGLGGEDEVGLEVKVEVEASIVAEVDEVH